MFSPPRHIFWISVAVFSVAAAPAQAASTGGFLSEASGYASEAAWAIEVYLKAIAAGDLPHIRSTSYVLSGIIGLVGLWLLAMRPRAAMRPRTAIALLKDWSKAPRPTDAAGEASLEGEGDRPIRLLEAIAAAKAQMSISEAEKKHAH